MKLQDLLEFQWLFY